MTQRATPPMTTLTQRRTEFLANMGLLMCLVALSIDSILPALGEVETAFALDNPNDRQWMLTALFMGFALGQVVFGPLGDRYGRKPIITLGMAIALVGTLLSVIAADYGTMIAGRVLQGFGIAAPRVLSVAMVRDRFVGAEMARAMALVSTVFLLAPVVAPAAGQLLLYVLPWRALFIVTALIGVIGVVWMLLRQPESLPTPVPLRPTVLLATAKEIISHRVAMGYTLAGAVMYGGMIGYIATSQQVYQEIYTVGDAYALILGLHGALIAVTLWLNRPLTQRLSLITIVQVTALFMTLWSGTGLAAVWLVWGGAPPLWMAIAIMVGMALSVGFLFGNLAAIALEPLGHVAGNAAALQNAIGAAIALSVAAVIGAQLQDRFLPIAAGYFITSVITLSLMRWASSGSGAGTGTGSGAESGAGSAHHAVKTGA